MNLHFHVTHPHAVIGGAGEQLALLIRELGCPYLLTCESAEVMPFFLERRVLATHAPTLAALVRAVDRFRPDVTQFYNCGALYHALQHFRDRPQVVEVVHNRKNFGSDWSSYPKDLVDIVVCVSADAEACFRTRDDRAAVVIIPHGVDHRRFTPRARRVLADWRATGGFAGRLEPGDSKGVAALVRLAAALPANFELVGTDPGGWGASALPPNVQVFPYTVKIEEFYRRWDFFVSMSPDEGFGLSIAEALASGLPAVVLDCGGVCRYLTDGVHAFVVRSEAEALARLEDVLADRHHLTPASLDLSVDRMVSAYYHLYEDLLVERAR